MKEKVKEEKHLGAIEREKVKTLIKEFEGVIGNGFLDALVLNREGLVLEDFNNKQETDLIKNLDKIISKIKARFPIGSFGAGIFGQDQNTILIFELGQRGFFIMTLPSRVRIDAFIFAYLISEKLSQIYDGLQTNLLIPKLFFHNLKSIQFSKRKRGTIQQIRLKDGEAAFKLILGGDKSVGKSSVVRKISDEVVSKNHKLVIGTSIIRMELVFEALELKVRFVSWNLASQAQFKRVRQSYMGNADVGILVYDVTSRQSFENIENWHNEIVKVSPEILIILVGNKTDLKWQVTTAEGEKLAQKLGCISYVESSPNSREILHDALKLVTLKLILNFLLL